ncbi:MAG: YqgE/AlgH family protein [Acidimicrobiia bacterium]|nr:YqgE/AlgH family protein [Acidimicrobiia bacterium]
MTSDSATPLHAGKLLVAAPSLGDPNFARSVVLLCEVNEEGALGLTLNRASDSAASDYLPQWQCSPPSVVFGGGPVQPEIAVGLARHRGEEPVGFSGVIDEIGLFDLATPAELVSGALSHLRIFSGYAGWAFGQLEVEVISGDWILVDSASEDAFTQEPDTLWDEVLRRQGGDIALLAGFPEDPTLN